MIDMDIDFIQIQRRAVDVPLLKKKYGDKIGLDLHVEGLVYYDPDPPLRSIWRISAKRSIYTDTKAVSSRTPREAPRNICGARFTNCTAIAANTTTGSAESK
jgi:hypothetical protein